MFDATPTLKKLKEVSRPEMVFALAHVPGGRRVVFGGSDFGVYDVDFAQENPEPRKLGTHESYVTGVALAEGVVISGGYDGRLIWSDLEPSAGPIRNVEAHAKWIRDVAVSPDGSVVASVADDMVCRVWDAKTGEKRLELNGHEAQTPHHFPSMLYVCTFSPDSRFLATGDKVGHIVVWDVNDGKPAAVMEAPTMYTWDPKQRRHSIGGIRSLTFAPDGNSLAVGGMGQVGNIDHLEGNTRIEIFSWRDSKRTHEFPGETFKGLVERLIFLKEGSHLLGVGGDNGGFVMCLDLNAKSVVLSEKAPSHIHDAALGDTPEVLFIGMQGRLVEYELTC